MNVSTVLSLGKRPQPTKSVVISFTSRDMEHITNPHDDAFVNTTEFNGFNVKRILVNSGISTYVFFLSTLLDMRKMKKDLKKVDFLLIGFAGRTTYVLRGVNLSMVLGEGWKLLRTEVIFIVVNSPNPNNDILG